MMKNPQTSRQADRGKVLERGKTDMKKRLMAVLALILIISLQTVTVFASEYYPSPSGDDNDTTDEEDIEDVVDDAVMPPTGLTVSGLTLSGDVVMLNGETNTTLRLYRLRLNTGDVTESNDVVIGMIEVGDAQLNDLDETSYNLSREKLIELADQAKLDGYDADGIAFDVTSSEQEQTITFMDSRIEEIDNYNGMVKVFHLLPSGEWEEPEFVCQNGTITIHFQNGFSPVMIVKYSKSADYTTKPVTTVSGATSPKTSETAPYAIPAALAFIGFIGIVIFGRKMAGK
jgi:hypothetical protein